MKLLLLSGGLIFITVRGLIYYITKFSQNNIISRIVKNPSRVLEYIPNLDIPICKMENSRAESIDLIRQKIGSSIWIGSYNILHTVLVNDKQFLVFTQLSFAKFDVGITGHSGDVSTKCYHDFLFSYDDAKADLTMYSTLYNNATEKFQKEDFYKILMESK